MAHQGPNKANRIPGRSWQPWFICRCVKSRIRNKIAKQSRRKNRGK